MTASPALSADEFAKSVLHEPLWSYQSELAQSPARFRCVVAGRQVGKSRGLSVLALFEACTRRNVLVLVVSAGEEAAKRLLAECSALAARSDVLRSSVVEDGKSLLAFSNGSQIRSVPASERQIRGWPVDLLIVDEAAFIPNEIWDATLPVIVARPGSRVVCTSSPWGSSSHWFRSLWNEGNDDPGVWAQSWHWTSYDSPLADKALLDHLRERLSSAKFAREYLGEFTDDSGAFFSEQELMDCVADYRMCDPDDLEFWLDGRFAAAAGVDWGYAQDANALALVSPLDDHGLNAKLLGDGLPLFVPWFEFKYRWPYTQFIERVVHTASKYRLPVVVSETNGVGQYPTTMLDERMTQAGHMSVVAPVVTDVRRKQSGFGMLKGLLQTHRMVLPRDPELLKQLRTLEFEQLPSGSLRIAVPESFGHDDIAMSLMQAVSAVWMPGMRRPPVQSHSDVETVSTPFGVQVPLMARPVPFHREAFEWPKGSEQSEVW